MFHYTRDSVEGHLSIVFAILASSGVTEERSGWSIKKLGLLHRWVTSDLACLRAVGKDVAVPELQHQGFHDDMAWVALDCGEGVATWPKSRLRAVSPVATGPRISSTVTSTSTSVSGVLWRPGLEEG